MRNLLEYPVTDDEMINCLTTIADEIEAEIEAEQSVGDMRPLLLRTAAARLSTMKGKGHALPGLEPVKLVKSRSQDETET